MKVFLLIVLFAFPVFSQIQTEIIVPATFLRKSPASTAEKIQSVQKGDRIVLEKSQDTNGWYYVSIADGKIKGWLNGNTIRSATPTETVTQSPTTIPQSSKTVFVAPQAASQTPSTAVKNTLPVLEPQTSSAEHPNKDEDVLHIDTEEVSLSVRVLDENKRPVNDLGKSQFQIYEDAVLQPITSLTTAEVPTKYALLVDNSRSLRTQLEKIAEAGKLIIETNRPVDEAMVVRFVSADKIEVIQDFTSSKPRLGEAMNNLFVEGGQTAIVDAIYLTAKRVNEYGKTGKKDDLKRRALILVSDGDDRASTHAEQQLFDLLRASDVQIYAIGFVKDLKNADDLNGVNRQEKAKRFLTRLAEETGGKVYFPDSVDELSRIASDISSDLRTQYLITYAPTDEKGSNAFRNIKVVVADGIGKEKRTAITRSGRASNLDEKMSQPNPQNPVRRP